MQVKKDAATGDSLGTGRRKSAIARVRIRAGAGKITVNGKELKDYFTVEKERQQVVESLEAVSHREDVDVDIRCTGGGVSGQAGAARLGIARALVAYDSNTFAHFRGNGFLTRDSRMKERKKYGLRGARRGTQFSKR